MEEDGTRIPFVAVRRSLGRITGKLGLMVDVAQKLPFMDRWEQRARLSGAYVRCYMIYVGASNYPK